MNIHEYSLMQYNDEAFGIQTITLLESFRMFD